MHPNRKTPNVEHTLFHHTALPTRCAPCALALRVLGRRCMALALQASVAEVLHVTVTDALLSLVAATLLEKAVAHPQEHTQQQNNAEENQLVRTRNHSPQLGWTLYECVWICGYCNQFQEYQHTMSNSTNTQCQMTITKNHSHFGYCNQTEDNEQNVQRCRQKGSIPIAVCEQRSRSPSLE